MDYEEFLWAKGYGPNTVEDLYAHIIEARPFSDLEMEVFSSLFMDYCILGGMPVGIKLLLVTTPAGRRRPRSGRRP